MDGWMDGWMVGWMDGWMDIEIELELVRKIGVESDEIINKCILLMR